MVINQSNLNQLLKGKRSNQLEEAEAYENRLGLHGTETDKAPSTDAFKNFLKQYPISLLPEEKAETFKSLITYPLPTVSLIKEIYSELWKVFDAQNKVESFTFEKEENLSDFQSYRQKIKEPNYWSSIAWKLIQTNVNSIVVIDLDNEQTTDKPEPIFFTVPISSVVFLEETDNQENLEVLIWKGNPNHEQKTAGIEEVIYIYDKASYQVATKKSNSDWFIEDTQTHDLGYCPARYLWSDKRGEMQKSAPHGSELGNLDWILYQTISGRNLELYAGFPIITTYQEDCSYVSEDGVECESGYINNVTEINGERKYDQTTCPDCSSRSLVGPGSVKEVPAPVDNQSADLMPAAEITKGDVDSLEWFESSLDTKIAKVKLNVVGAGGEPNNNQAKNTKQIESGFENKQTILSNIARNLEKIQKFTLDTIAKLRYGDDFDNSIISYGNKFFLQTEAEALENYNRAKKEGLPNYILEDYRLSMLHKRYRNDPDMLKRVILLDFLEPLPDYSLDNINTVTFIDQKVVFKKMNFNDLIKRFELEHGNIVKFREGIDLNVRVAKINEVLDKYVEETFVKPPPPEPVNKQ